MVREQKFFLQLISTALGHPTDFQDSLSAVNWNVVYKIAEQQNLVAFTFCGIEKLPKEYLPEMDLLMDWLGQTEYCKTAYQAHKDTIEKLAGFYDSQCIKMVLLKGYGLSLNYPVPNCRPTGDIDVYLFDLKEFADQMVESKSGLKVDREYHKHSHFTFEGVTVENHEKFMDDEKHDSNIKFLEILEELLSRKSILESPISNCYLPSDTFNALFLLRHLGGHFAINEISMRHILDYGTFLQKHNDGINWDYVISVIREENMYRLYNAVATICVRNLGFDASFFPNYVTDNKMADRVLEDIFKEKKNLPMSISGMSWPQKLKYGVQKSMRWWNNRWKYKMVYNDSLWSSFWSLAINRLKNS